MNQGSELYLGEYEHALDSQCRVTLPSDWRNREGETELVLIPARDKALVLLPLATFMEFVNKAKKLAIANPKMQMAFARLVVAAVPLRPAGAYRTRPENARRHRSGQSAQIDRRVDAHPALCAAELAVARQWNGPGYLSG